jgi:hypothetical protein
MSGESSHAGEGESTVDPEPRRQHAPMDAAPELFAPPADAPVDPTRPFADP